MATKARVELRGALSYSSAGRSFKRGVPQIITNAHEIAKYQATSDFSVTILDEERVRAKVKTGASKKAPVEEKDDPITDDEIEESLDGAREAEDDEEEDTDEDDGEGEPQPEAPKAASTKKARGKKKAKA